MIHSHTMLLRKVDKLVMVSVRLMNLWIAKLDLTAESAVKSEKCMSYEFVI